MGSRFLSLLGASLFYLPQWAIADTAVGDPWNEQRWNIRAVEAERVDFKGQQALKLKGGIAVLRDRSVTEGVIEFDLAVGPERGFVGGVFRVQDDENYEHFYIRPHQSGNPDANQYTPVIHGASGWQLYHGEGYATALEYPFDQWQHLKIVFAGKNADIYIDSDQPVLRVVDLKRPIAAGGVGVNAANYVSAYFANFSLSALPEDYVFAANQTKAVQGAGHEAGVVSSWSVSDAFSSQNLAGVTRLSDSVIGQHTWTELPAESSGITNLAHVQGITEQANTAFARVKVRSESEQIKIMEFGYSDAVSVFVNGTLTYRGTNLYRSRDYRYLGTMGWFDSLAVPLQEGDNEIWFAVSEAFGGWGVMARFSEPKGISF